MSSPFLDSGRFLPGTVLANRYRIIGLLGRGGMGEVYRADDLRLGQPVALKFLPAQLSGDADRLARFVNEARVARQVTHPNVCRVHDLGEVDGQQFISMEYVDGEELGTLLSRIGRLPEEKAAQVARQLCAGLAAAHDQGILHRDLKPANIMLDGRGRVRITDFGLAGLAEDLAGDEHAGTPAYQAPEQLEGRDVSTASDTYSLGLVLYEVFTGKKAFEADSIADLKRRRLEAAPASLSSHVDGLDAAIEAIILRCLAPNPQDRPESMLSIAAALPGADPLAAALAAGETPSPEMIVNAGETGGPKAWIAVALLAAVIGGYAFDLVYRTRTSTIARVGLTKSNTELRIVARQILEELGHDTPPADSAYRLERDTDYFRWLERSDLSSDRLSRVSSVKPSPIYFWYRESPSQFEVDGFSLFVSQNDPVPQKPGEVSMRLDARGRLTHLTILPEIVRSADPGSDSVDWTPALQRSGIEMASLVPTRPRANPPLNCGHARAWEGTYPEQPDTPIRIEACSVGGQPSYFEMLPPWNARAVALGSEDPDRPLAAEARIQAMVPLLFSIFVAVLVGGILLARRNMRMGRADLEGARRLAGILFLLDLFGGLLEAHHGPISSEVPLLLSALAEAVLIAGFGWVFYLAAEPFIRRLWPDAIIAWRRLLDGRLRDPLVGRDILIGLAVAQLVIVARIGTEWTTPGREFNGGDLEMISGVARWAAGVMGSVGLMPALFLVTFFVLVRIVLRRDWLAWLVATAVPTTMITIGSGDPWNLLWISMIWGSMFFLVVRFGLLAVAAGGIASSFGNVVRVWDPESWYFPYVLASLIIWLAPAIYGFVVSLGGKKLFSAALLDS